MKTCKSYGRDGKGNDERTAGFDANVEGLLEQHAGEAHNFAWRLSGNAEEAKEVVQEASYRVLLSRERYEPLRSFKSWYLTIVRNVFLDARRAASKWNISLDRQMGEGELSFADWLSDGEPELSEAMERRELAGILREAVSALGKRYRVVVQLCDVDGLSYEEAARRLGIPLGTLRSRLSRARTALRKDAKVKTLMPEKGR